MDRPSQSEVRKAEHDRIATNARELGNTALNKLDSAMREQELFWENLCRWSGAENLTHDQAMAMLWANRNAGS